MNTPTLISKIVMSILIVAFYSFLYFGASYGVTFGIGKTSTWWIIASIIFCCALSATVLIVLAVKTFQWLWEKD